MTFQQNKKHYNNKKEGTVNTYMVRIKNCLNCEFVKKYDYGKKVYYCDHADRIDDMGKLSVNELPEESPEWCPFRKE